MRILHVIDPGSPGGGACTLQLLSEPLSRLNSVEQDVLLIGTERHEQLAWRCGVEPTGRITAARNEPVLAGFAGRNFKDFLRSYETRFGKYDIIHNWTARSTLLTSVAAPHHKRMATLSVGPVNGVAMMALAKAMQTRPCTILATSVSVKRDYMVMGIPEEQIDVLPPAVHPEAVEEHLDDRGTVRARWGLTGEKEHAFAVGLLSEPANWCDAREAMNTIAVAVEAGREMYLVVHPLAQRRIDAVKWAAKLGLDDHIVLDDDLPEPWRCVNGLDAALMLGDDRNAMDLAERGSPLALLLGGGRSLRPMSGVMPALWAMGAGVPVVAENSFALQEVIENGGTGLLFDQGNLNAATAALVKLYDDQSLRLRISQAARAHVHQHYHVSAYCVRLKDIYERIDEGRAARVVTEESDVVEQGRRFAEYSR